MNIVEGQGLVDVSYYMEEGCGIFAVAMATAIAGGSIGVLSRRHGEPFGRAFPYEVTHVFYAVGGHFFDVKGRRSLDDMAADFHMEGAYDIKGPWAPAEFRKAFMGNSDRKPLYGGADEIREALGLIRANPDRYSL